MAFKYDEYGDVVCPICGFSLESKEDYIFQYFICSGDCNDVYFDGEGNIIEDYDSFFSYDDEDADCFSNIDLELKNGSVNIE